MSERKETIQLISTGEINVLNPRVRSKKAFAELVASISALGLKKPVTVSPRPDGRYDLVCGQGRLEAFLELGQERIPAIVEEASIEDCFVRSLVENIARRQHTPAELHRDIGSLRARGYTDAEIATKTGFSGSYISAILHLLANGEQRLLAAVERGLMPYGIAMEIARADDEEVQAALAEAYENKSMPGNQVVAIRAIVDRRNRLGKSTLSIGQRQGPRVRVTSTALIRAYRKETERQRALALKAAIAEERLAFLTTALRSLMADERFSILLRAEHLQTLPQPLANRIQGTGI